MSGHVFLHPGEAMTEGGSLIADEGGPSVFSHFLRVSCDIGWEEGGVHQSPDYLAILLYALFSLAGLLYQ